MLESALRYLKEELLGQQAIEPLSIPGRKQRQYFNVGGDIQYEELLPPNRFIDLRDFNSLMNLLNDTAGVLGERSAYQVGVFVQSDRIDVILDTANGYERATWQLCPAAPWAFVSSLHPDGMKGKPFSPHDLRQHLRINLHDVKDQDGVEALIDRIAKVRFTNTDAAAVDHGRGKESLGASITRQVADETPMPDERQTWQIRRWDHPRLSMKFPIKLLLDPDMEDRCWRLIPLAGELERIEAEAACALRGLIVDHLDEESPVDVLIGRFDTND
jgi:hypothetical protein